MPDVEFVTQKIPKRPQVYHLGTYQPSQLTFPLEFYSDEPIYAYKREQIAAWLSGNGKFGKLKIIQDDMVSQYYNCYFSKLDWNSVHNVGFGFTGTVVCDAPYAWRLPITYKKENTPVDEVGEQYPEKTIFFINNTSTDYIPIIPNVTIALAPHNNSFKLNNLSSNKSFEFKQLQNGEIIYIDNLMIIESLTNPNKIIVDNFSGSFLKLIRGKNVIEIEGQIKYIHIKYQLSRKIGG